MANPIDIIIQVAVKGGEKFAEISKSAEKMKRPVHESISAIATSANVLEAALGDHLTASAKKAFDGLDTIAGAALAGNSVLPGYGALVGGVAASVFVLGEAVTQASPEVQAFNKQIEMMAKPDQAVQGLRELAGVSEGEATVALKAAASNKDFAITLNALKDATESSRPMRELQGAVDELGKTVDRAVVSGKQLFVVMTYGSSLATGLAKNYGDYAKAQEQANQATRAAMEFTFGDVNAKNKLADAVTKLAPEIVEQNRLFEKSKTAIAGLSDESDAYADSVKKLSDAHKKAQSGFGSDILKAKKDLGDERVKLNESANADIAKAESDLGKERAKINTDLLEKLGDIEQDRTDKKSDAYYDYAKSVGEIERDITKAVADNAQERANIERDSRQAIADLDSQTGLKLLDAQTEHTAQKIKYEADLERAKLTRERGDQLNDLAAKKKASDDEFAHRRQLRDEDYAHAKSIDDREHGQTVARLQREAAQARQAAQDRTADEIAQITQRTAAQIKAAGERTQKEVAGIRERANEETTAYNQSVKDAQTAHDKKIGMLRDMRTDTQKLNDDIGKLGLAWDDPLTQALKYKSVVEGIHLPGASPDIGGGGTSGFGGPGTAKGADFVVPSGFPNDTFPMRVSSGEHVVVTMAGSRSSESVNNRPVLNITMNINEARNPRWIAEEINRILRETAWQ